MDGCECKYDWFESNAAQWWRTKDDVKKDEDNDIAAILHRIPIPEPSSMEVPEQRTESEPLLTQTSST